MNNYFYGLTYDEWRRRQQTGLSTTGPDGDCQLCGGSGWAAVPDPFFNGALVDQRCPACQDTTVRATKRRWVSDDGREVGPRG